MFAYLILQFSCSVDMELDFIVKSFVLSIKSNRLNMWMFILMQNGIANQACCGYQGDRQDGISWAGDSGEGEIHRRSEPFHHEKRQGTGQGGRHPHLVGI